MQKTVMTIGFDSYRLISTMAVIWFIGFFLIPGSALSFEPVEIHAGRIVGGRMTVDEVRKLNLNDLLLTRRFASPELAVEHDARLRPPDAGKAYLIIEVSLKDQKSIGKYDYRVQFRNQDQVYRCIAMARGNDVFDPRLWEITAEGAGLEPVQLLYETTEAEGEVEILLVPDLSLPVTLETVSFKVAGARLE